MSENNKHIDNLFKEALAHYKETPPSYIWNAIDKELKNEKKQKLQLVLWQSISVAAILGVIFLCTLLWQENSESTPSFTHDLNNFQKTEKKDIGITDTFNINKTLITKNISIVKKRQIVQNSYTTSSLNQKQSIFRQNNLSLHKLKNKKAKIKSSYYNQTLTQPTTKHSTPTNKKDSQLFASLIPNKEPLTPNKSKPQKTKIAIGGHFTPMYSFREFDSKSPQASPAQTESGITTYSGGINICFQRKAKWSIETGVYYARIGQNFSNSTIYQSAYTLNTAYSKNKTRKEESLTNPNLQNSLGQIKLIRQINESDSPYPGIAYQPGYKNNTTQTPITLNLQQELDFIEIPFLIRYNLHTNNIKLSFSGGINTNLLVENNAYLLSNSQKEYIGETENLNKINYSTQLGIGFHTPIFKSITFNIEPKLKYFINSVTKLSEINYRPYSFGLYTGVSYQFN
jgi:hypothetical protein